MLRVVIDYIGIKIWKYKQILINATSQAIIIIFVDYFANEVSYPLVGSELTLNNSKVGCVNHPLDVGEILIFSV